MENRVVVQAVSSGNPTAEAWVRSQTSSVHVGFVVD